MIAGMCGAMVGCAIVVLAFKIEEWTADYLTADQILGACCLAWVVITVLVYVVGGGA